MTNITSRDQIFLGCYVYSEFGIQEVIEIHPERSEPFGLPSFVTLYFAASKNIPQKISFDTLTGYKLINKKDNPEYFL